jgi:ankyrin repeat protein
MSTNPQLLLIICALLSLLASPASAQSDAIMGTPFISAVNRGNAREVEEMITSGEPVNQRDTYGRSALMLTVLDDHCNVTILLLKYGARTEYRDEEGKTALMWAAAHGNLICLRALLLAHADVNAADKEGITALMMAASAGVREAVQELVEAKANVNATDYTGLTVLGYAVHARQKRIADILRAAGGHD